MPTRYFATNTLAGCRRSSSQVTEVTTAGRFDSAFVDRAIQPGAAGDYFEIGAPFNGGATSITGTLYLRFDLYVNTITTNNTVVQVFNGATSVYRLLCTNGTSPPTYQMQYWNSGTSAWVNWGSSFQINNASLFSYQLQLALGTSFDFTQNGVSLASSSTAATNGATAVTNFRFGNIATQSNGFFSQLMCADYDIRNSNLMSKLASANGNYTDGTGTFSDVNELSIDDDGFIGLPASGNKKTFTKGSITVPSGRSIAAMAVNIRGRVGGGTVTDGKALIRSSTTDSLSSSLGFGLGFEPHPYITATDPATGTQFTESGFNAAEFGLQAV